MKECDENKDEQHDNLNKILNDREYFKTYIYINLKSYFISFPSKMLTSANNFSFSQLSSQFPLD